MLLLSPIKVMQFYRAILNSHYSPASGISSAVMILGVMQDCVRQQVSAQKSFGVFSVLMAKRMLERLAVGSALKVLPLRCQALLGVK